MIQLADNIAISSTTVINDRLESNGGKYVVTPGATLTVNKMPLDGLDQLFDGPGSVCFGPDVPYVRAEWFGAGKGGDDGAILNKAIAAAAGHTLRVERDLAPTTPIVLRGSASLEARKGSCIYCGNMPAGATALSILGQGDIGHVLPKLVGAPHVYIGLYIEDCYRVDCEAPYVGSFGAIGILMDSGTYTSNNWVHGMYCGDNGLNSPNALGCNVCWRSLTPGGMQGNRITYNFFNNAPTNELVFTSGDSNQDSNITECDTIDLGTGPGPLGAGIGRNVFWALINGAPNAAYRHELHVHGWAGGWNPDACLIRGPIAGCQFTFPSLANGLPNPWQYTGAENLVTLAGTVISDPAK